MQERGGSRWIFVRQNCRKFTAAFFSIIKAWAIVGERLKGAVRKI